MRKFVLLIGFGVLTAGSSAYASGQAFTVMDFLSMMPALDEVREMVLHFAVMMMLPFFTFAVLMQQVEGLDGKPNYWKPVIRVVMILAFFGFYQTFFEKSYLVCRDISERVLNDSEFRQIMDDLWINSPYGTDASLLDIWAQLKGGMGRIIISLSYLFALVMFYFLMIVRNTLLGFLYVIGPLWVVVSLLPKKDGVFYNFVENVLIIDAWSIVGNILQKIFHLTVFHGGLNAESNFVPLVASNIVLASLLIATPRITTMAVQGAGLGGSRIMEVAGVMAFGFLKGRLGNFVGGIKEHAKERWDGFKVAKKSEASRPGDSNTI